MITGLVSYWALDEASGNALDAHGSNALTDHNSVGATTGLVSGARDLESGSSQYFSHANNTDLTTGDIDFSFAGWVLPESLGSFPCIITKRGVPAVEATTEFIVYYDPPGRRRYAFQVNNGYVYSDSFGAPSPATWHFIVVIHDSVQNLLEISVNDTGLDAAGYSGGAPMTTADFQLGASVDQSLFWDGLMDGWGFWKRALRPADITWLYNGGSGRSYADIVAEAGGVGKPTLYYAGMRA